MVPQFFMLCLYVYGLQQCRQLNNNEHSGGCRREPSTPAEGGRRAKLVCRYRVYRLSEAIKLKTRRTPAGFLVLQSHLSHTCNIWGTSAFLPMGCNDWFTFQYFHVVFCMQIYVLPPARSAIFLSFEYFLYFYFFLCII